MGLDATKKTPCGFCFVSYFTRKDAEAAVKYINGSMMDGRSIRVDHDWGFVEGRQFGRGRSGGQVSAYLLHLSPQCMTLKSNLEHMLPLHESCCSVCRTQADGATDSMIAIHDGEHTPSNHYQKYTPSWTESIASSAAMQVRDEHRTDYDQGRGGYGQLMWQEIETRQMAAVGQAEFESNPAYNRQDSNRGRKRQQRENDTYQQQSRNPRARDDDDD